jgi:hypothetical protein
MEHVGILPVGGARSTEARSNASFDMRSLGMFSVYNHNVRRGVITDIVCHVDVGRQYLDVVLPVWVLAEELYRLLGKHVNLLKVRG